MGKAKPNYGDKLLFLPRAPSFLVIYRQRYLSLGKKKVKLFISLRIAISYLLLMIKPVSF